MDAGHADNSLEARQRDLEAALRILRGAVAAKASDVHLKAGSAPRVRIRGQVVALEHPPLSPELVTTLLQSLSVLAGVEPVRWQSKQLDYSCEVQDLGRFRIHAFRQNGHWAGVLRYVRKSIPDLAALRLPPVVKRIAQLERGLVLVTGATGNGKSTTIASLLDHINTKLPKHIVTLEDPIEYVFSDNVASFSQREIGRDVDSIQQGLEGALREDPDVLFVGETRNLQEFEVAMHAAESGRLVITTFHSVDVERALARVISMFPNDRQDQARNRLADILSGVISQKLIPQSKSTELILATEVLTRSPTVIDCIRDPARMRAITAALEKGTNEYGSHSFDQVLMGLVKDGLVALETAKAHVHSANDFVRAMNLSR
ncbi:MAG: PilT/PilU family type 4a pilus ATPase [Polyangiales bacterium]